MSSGAVARSSAGTRTLAGTRTIVTGRSSGTPSVVVGAAPVLSAINANPVTQIQATINWTIDQNATGTVNYGLTAGYGSSVTASEYLPTHALVLSGLTPETTYHYRVRSTNIASQETVSGDQTFTTSAVADQYPPDQSGLDFIAFPAVSAVPTYLIPQADAMGFDTVVTRISTFANAMPRYSPIPAWNSDKSRLYLDYADGGYQFDGQTFQFIRQASVGYYPAYTSPLYSYMAWSGDNFLQRKDVYNNGSWAPIKTFSEYPAQGGFGIGLDTHAAQSWDDEYWGITGRLANGQRQAFVWERTADIRWPRAGGSPAGAHTPFNTSAAACNPSASGDYVAITDTATQVMRIYYRLTGTLLQTINSPTGAFPHNDFGKDVNGDDCVVAVDSANTGSQRITMWRMVDGWKTQYLAATGAGNPVIAGGYVSCKAVHMNGSYSGGWAFFATGDVTHVGLGAPGFGQIFAIKLDVAETDGGIIADPTCKVYGFCQPGTYSGSMPERFSIKPVPSPDGLHVAFASVWRQGSSASAYSYILSMP